MRRKFTRVWYLILLVVSFIGLSLMNSLGQDYKNGALQDTNRIKLNQSNINEDKPNQIIQILI